MKTIYAHSLEVSGVPYEAGYSLGKIMAGFPGIKSKLSTPLPDTGQKEYQQAYGLFERWCPELNEELKGFADGMEIQTSRLLYYSLTCLHPRCSHISLLPSMTDNSHPLTARSYEFNDEAEDFIVIKTDIKGKYTHIGTSVLGIGRDDGLNDQGLAVTMSSCGFPVGADKHMRAPAITGLQFWAIIRILLEHCRNVDEALSLLKDMPIAYNLNMILLDKDGNSALVETLDGRKAVKIIGPATDEQYLHATNHPLLDELIPYEPQAMDNSILRYETIQEFADSSKGRLNQESLKKFLLTPYPRGLSCPYYSDFFGTTKSMVLDPLEGTLELCWGGRIQNGWQHFSFEEPWNHKIAPVQIENMPASPSMFKFRSIV